MSLFVGVILEVAELDGDGHYIMKPIAGRMYPCVRVRRQEARGFCRLAHSWLRMVVESEGAPRTSRRVAASAALAALCRADMVLR